MKFGNWWGIVGPGLATIAFSAALLSPAQYTPSNGGLPHSHQGLGGSMETDPAFLEKRDRALNLDRHKSMVSDTDKLVKLARQLEAEIASNPTDQLTPEELHKVAEIEKLAHNVKTKMAQSFDGGPHFVQSPVPIGGPPTR